MLCEATMRHLFSARDYRRLSDPSEYILNWCNKCQFGRLEGEFSPEKVEGFYKIAYYTHASTAANLPGVRSFSERLRSHLAWRLDHGVEFRPSELGEPNERGVCDIGCGNGSKLEMLKNAGFQIAGVEPDPNARAIAMKVGEVFDGTAERLPPQVKERNFDVVIVSHVLEHCIDPKMAIKNIRSIIKPGGCVVIEVPNNASVGFAKFQANWPWSDIPRHINFFTERSLKILLHSQTFGNFSVNYVGYFRQFVSDWVDSQNEIWTAIGTGSRPNFSTNAWFLLARTAFAPRSRKYDSVRIRARPLDFVKATP
jgi:SAM-dependent methyltransferase